MKKFALLNLILAVFLVGFKPENLIRLTVINKSEVDIAIRLTNVEKELNYYLTTPKGDREFPSEKDFFIEPAVYNMQVFYVETWDPVYGFPKCGGLIQLGKMVAIRNLRVVFNRCYQQPPNPGEPTMMKFWLWKPWKYRYIFIR